MSGRVVFDPDLQDERSIHTEPFVGARVSVIYLGAEPKGDRKAPPLALAVTDEQGRYCFSGLPAAGPGTWVLVKAEAEGVMTFVRIFRLYPQERAVLDIALREFGEEWVFAADQPHIDPTKPGSGAVVVADPKTGEPVARPY